MLCNTDIVVLSPSEWQDNAVSNMQISAILSETNRVVYIETMGGRMPRLSELGRVWSRIKRMVGGVSRNNICRGLDQKNVTILSPFAIPIHGNAFINWINARLLTFQINRLLRKKNFRLPIVWSFSPRWQAVIRQLEKCCVIFHCVDALHTYDDSSEFKAQFTHCVKNADIVFTPGVLLERELRNLNDNTYRVGHGCGADHLEYNNPRFIPRDLKTIPEPRVIYAGTLANWVDYDLLVYVARSLPNISFVLIGYIHALAPTGLVKQFCDLPNVYHLGYKDFKELPSYYRNSNAGIVPYIQSNEHIQYSTPTKFLDYFAAGLPVVSTAYPAAKAMSELVCCASSPEMFSEELKRALIGQSSDNVLRRREYAKDHTWQKQVEKMCNHIRRDIHEFEC